MSINCFSNEQLLKVLNRLRKRDFYGKLTFDMKKGEVMTVRQEETIKPQDVGNGSDSGHVVSTS